MSECIHGLELAACDICSPAPKPVVERPLPRQRAAAKAPAARPLKATAPRRLHVVLPLDELADLLADGELVDPIYFVGPEELAWGERRRAADAARNVVLVTTAVAVAGLDDLPLTAVELIAVANTVAQERVRELLALTSYSPRVAVFPPWFTAPED